MVSPSLQAAITRNKRTLLVIWLAFLAAPVIYLVVAYYVLAGSRAGATMHLPAFLPYVVLVGGLGLAGMVYTISRKQMARAAKGDVAPSGAGGSVVAPPELDADERTLYFRLALYQTAMIIRWAGFEALAVYGLVLVVVMHTYPPIVYGAALALLLILLNRPAADDFLEACQWRGHDHYQQ